MDLMRMLDLNIAGEFLVMAATLMMIKSRMLLPENDRGEEEEEEDDPRWDLVRQLVEYKKFKDAAHHLQHLEIRQENVFGRGDDEVVLGAEPEAALQDVSIFDLIAAFKDALSRVQKEELKEIFADRYTVGEKIDAILELLQSRPTVSFLDLLAPMRSRGEMICTFLAILELIRLNQIRARQDDAFGEIVVEGVA
jgi:segregation and condensation protein A